MGRNHTLMLLAVGAIAFALATPSDADARRHGSCGSWGGHHHRSHGSWGGRSHGSNGGYSNGSCGGYSGGSCGDNNNGNCGSSQSECQTCGDSEQVEYRQNGDNKEPQRHESNYRGQATYNEDNRAPSDVRQTNRSSAPSIDGAQRRDIRSETSSSQSRSRDAEQQSSNSNENSASEQPNSNDQDAAQNADQSRKE
jgi:hypothetical protein